MAQPTTESERVTARPEPSQQLLIQVSDWIFRLVESHDHLVAVVEVAGSACIREAHPQFLTLRWFQN
jgi:hypothetical protein